MNVPGAIGASREPVVQPAAAAEVKTSRPLGAQAAALRDELMSQQELRVSRVREAKAEADEKARKAKEAAEKAAEKAKRAAEKKRVKWVSPLRGARLSAGFGQSSYLWSSRHTGQDFSASHGDAVRSVGDGRIVSSGWDGAYGQKLVVRHDDGTEAWYAHLSSYVRTSGRVRAGEVIARVGSTGNSTGSHLHLEIRASNGDPIEPVGWLRRQGAKL
jgi:murein DD-endopeptidase MepM/ murein hydrolase activator NlpD